MNMNGNISNVLSKVFGLIGILVTLTMISTIYTANVAINTAITSATNSASFLVLPTLIPFGGILIPLGLLFGSGMLLWKGQKATAGIGYIVTSVLTIIAVLIALNFFPSIITSFDTILTSAIAASDTIGELFYGLVFPLLLYLLIVVAPAFPAGVSYVKNKVGKKKARTASAVAY